MCENKKGHAKNDNNFTYQPASRGNREWLAVMRERGWQAICHWRIEDNIVAMGGGAAVLSHAMAEKAENGVALLPSPSSEK